MAHKSHRQKALQSQLEPAPAISLVTSQPKASSSAMAMDLDSDEDELLITSTPAASALAGPSSRSATVGSALAGPEAAASSLGFAPLSTAAQSTVLKNEFRRVPIPPHRMSPLKREWVNIYTPMVEMLGLQVRMNVKRRCVEMKVGARGRGLDCKHMASRFSHSPYPRSCLVLHSSRYPLNMLSHVVVLHLWDFAVEGLYHSESFESSGSLEWLGAVLTPPVIRPLRRLGSRPEGRRFRQGLCAGLRGQRRAGPTEAGRPLPRLIRDQGCEDAARGPSLASHR